ncbi:MAG: preprotein translocase subunit SecG [Proteobacteria bacterium]|nr:preprotein translocase subunit SecG [Pseudomonadota bacterium]
MFTIFSVFYVLIAAALTVLILIQRGDGANAGASFGGGASGTVFGARGSASFLTRATGVLAALFFVLSLGMGIYLSRAGVTQPKADLGVMAGATAPAASATTAAASGKLPPAPANAAQPPAAPAANSEVPQATAPAQPAPKPATTGGH